LYYKGLISISPESDPDSCEFDDNISKITGYYPEKVIWEFLPGMDAEKKKSFIKILEEFVNDNRTVSLWQTDIVEAWRLVNKFEAIEYYLHLLEQRGFIPKKIGQKTHTVFDELLNHHSIAQIFNLTWQAVRDTADWALANKIPKYHAVNAFIGAVQKKSEKYRAEKWDLNYSRRDFNCPQSTISSTLFDGIMKIGQKFMEIKPSYSYFNP